MGLGLKEARINFFLEEAKMDVNFEDLLLLKNCFVAACEEILN